jgi:hypothetical protein
MVSWVEHAYMGWNQGWCMAGMTWLPWFMWVRCGTHSHCMLGWWHMVACYTYSSIYGQLLRQVLDSAKLVQQLLAWLLLSAWWVWHHAAAGLVHGSSNSSSMPPPCVADGMVVCTW